MAGLGIGLTLVRSLIEMHGGRIEGIRLAWAMEASSSCVCRCSQRRRIWRPANKAGRTLTQCALARDVLDMAIFLMKKHRILVAEDDSATLYAYSRQLRAAGYETLEAATGAECLRAAIAERPDLVVLDVRLPELDGMEVCRRIKADPRLSRIFVLLVSGLATSAESQAHGLEEGADGYLPKPVDGRMLLAQVRALLRLRNAEAALVDQQARELSSLEQFSQPPQGGGEAQLSGSGPLRKTHPEAFETLLEQYGELLDLALEQRQYKVEHSIPERLRAMAGWLGSLRAGPRDVVDFHSSALRNRTAGVLRPQAQAYVEEGRVMVLQLMGYLVSYYRIQSMGMLPPRPPAV
jgi:CheY-like chemotaxis protein